MEKPSVKKRTLILGAGPAVIAVFFLWMYMNGGRYVSTENAYLKSEISVVSSELSTKVFSVHVKDNDRLKKGDVVVSLYPITYEIALARAEANLANIRGELQSLLAKYEKSKLDIANAQTEFNFRQLELKRMRKLLNEESISIAQFDQAQYNERASKNKLNASKQELLVVKAKLIDPEQPVESHPRYLHALAELNTAKVDMRLTKIRAPSDGVATNVSVHDGENIYAGTGLLNLVDDNQFWIEANFKETDLTYVRAGQPVEIEIDTYPGVQWKGRVESITPAAGSEFSLLPAQNSSGNWIKVVQRIMVKISLEDRDRSLPLSAGMSTRVSIDTSHNRSIFGSSENQTADTREF